jgi:predicted kinase
VTKKMIMTKGLPGSGKSTWAKEHVSKNTNQWKRVNKDDLRAMLDDSVHSKGNENFVINVRDQIILAALEAGKHVIVDDTNFHPKHEKRLRELAAVHDAHFEIKDFTDVPLEVCIDRDRKRPNSVGEAVIRNMHNENLKPKASAKVHTYLEQDQTLPKAILVDIDGTMAMMAGRGPFEWHRVGEDLPHDPVLFLLKYFLLGNRKEHEWEDKQVSLIVLSGRDAVCRDETTEWLHRHGIFFTELLMRPEKDNRKDNIVKEEIFRNNIHGKYNVQFVLDDRDQVVQMWREIGLPCFQVAPGAF